MNLDTDILIEKFSNNFLLKERRERSLFELRSPHKRNLFVNKLNHKWDQLFDMRKLVRLDSEVDDFAFAKQFLNIKDSNPCYIISNYDDLDGQVFIFKEAFDKCYGRGLATLVIDQNADRIFLETEIGYGTQNRFLGKSI